MKTLLTLAALSALTLCSLEAQQTPAPAKAEQLAPADKHMGDLPLAGSGKVEPVTNPNAPIPTLTEPQRFAIRDAQYANQQFTAYYEKVIQPQLDKIPEYVNLMKRVNAATVEANKVTAEIVKACPDCKIDYEALTLTRPQLAAKAEEKPKENK